MISSPRPRWWTGRLPGRTSVEAVAISGLIRDNGSADSSGTDAMKFSGQLSVPAAREAVFDRLRDAPFFASCVEGVGELVEVAPDRYAARFTTKIAYIRFDFEIAVDIVRAERPHAIEARIEGKPHGVV